MDYCCCFFFVFFLLFFFNDKYGKELRERKGLSYQYCLNGQQHFGIELKLSEASEINSVPLVLMLETGLS